MRAKKPQRRDCRIPRKTFEKLIEAYREKPAAHSHAARAAGVGLATARVAWDKGWERPEWATIPIRDLITVDQQELRSKLAKLERIRKAPTIEQKDRIDAEYDAVGERAREAQAVRAAMSTAMTALAVTGHVSKARVELARRIAESILDEARLGTINWREALLYLQRLASMDKQAIETLKLAMEASRLHLGEPEKFIRVQAAVAAPMDKVDGPDAVQVLGEEQLKQAIVDLAAGKSTQYTEQLIAYQLERAQRGPTALH